jgi:hypothetical protein
MNVLSSLVPPAKRVALFANPVNSAVPGAVRLTMPSGAKLQLVEIRTPYSDPSRYAGLNQWFQSSGGVSQTTTINAASETEIPPAVKEADLVIISKPAAADAEENTAFTRYCQAVKPGAVIIHPISPKATSAGFNFVHFVDQQRMGQVERAIEVIESQVYRVKYHLSRKFSCQAAAFAEGRGLEDPYLYAERFNFALITKEGKLQTFDRRVTFEEILALLELSGPGVAAAGSPHPDDYAIACAGFGTFLQSLGWDIFNLTMTISPRGVTDDYAIRFLQQHFPDIAANLPTDKSALTRLLEPFKEAIRIGETTLSDALLGVKASRPLGFYLGDRKDPLDASERIFTPDEAASTRTYFQAITDGRKLNLAMIPLKGDLHYTHRAVRRLYLDPEVLPKIAIDQDAPIGVFDFAAPWFTPIPTNALLYYVPDSRFRAMHPETYFDGLSRAESGRELALADFSLMPPGMVAFFDGENPIAEAFQIWRKN